MSKITLRFVEAGPHDIASQLIAWFTQGRYSHVEFVTPSGQALGSISTRYQASNEIIPAGVQPRPFNYIGDRKYKLLHFDTDVPESRFWKTAWSQVGKPYDKLAIAGFIFDRDWENPRAWMCSEFCTWVCVFHRIPILRVTDVSKITPDALALSPMLYE